ncbi:MAG: hypothetical protein WCQ99_16915 [Pseudomonadota bacterium]
MHYICAVEYEAGYRLRLKFEDASVKIVDLKEHLMGRFLNRSETCNVLEAHD